MAERSVIWTHTAIKQRRAVLEYWTKRNQSTLFAEKLIQVIAHRLDIIKKDPYAFPETDFKSVRFSAIGYFSLYYKVNPKKIIVMAFWDNRQDLKKLYKSLKED